jgi:5-methylthioadenosine/S-adenosylhomocysteine deaminase
MRLAALLAKAQSNDPTVLPARQAFELATISGARAVYMDHLAGSLEAGKRADFAVVNMGDIHNWPHFHNNPDAVYSRLVYAAKSSDVVDVMCNGRWLMQERQLLTVDEARIKKEAAEVAARIDAFVLEREASVFNKLVLLAGIERQESFEVQVKAALDNPDHILSVLRSAKIKIVRSAHYYQYDSYFLFANDPEADRLRYREDEFVNEAGEVYQARSRLTLLSPAHERAFDNAVMLSRSRYLAPATQSLRFYREYFAPAEEIKIHKDRLRWHIIYKETDFAINLDKPKKPELPAHYLEIKSRTWSRQDAERKVGLIAELLELFAVDLSRLEELEYLGMAR